MRPAESGERVLEGRPRLVDGLGTRGVVGATPGADAAPLAPEKHGLASLIVEVMYNFCIVFVLNVFSRRLISRQRDKAYAPRHKPDFHDIELTTRGLGP